jgi:hypothetical protein
MYWFGLFIAALCANKAIHNNDAGFAFATIIAILIGYALRYVFAGKKSLLPWK